MQSTEVERCYVDWVSLKIKHLNVLGLNHLQCFCSFVQDVKGEMNLYTTIVDGRILNHLLLRIYYKLLDLRLGRIQ